MINRPVLEAVIPPISLLAMLLSTLPLIAQVRAKSFPAIVVIGGLALLDVRHVVNTLAFYGGREASWDGHVFCDVDIKLRPGLYIVLFGAAACIFRRLANTVRTDRVGNMETKLEKLWRWLFDLTFCLVLPAVHTSIAHLALFSSYRYIPIAGCLPQATRTWRALIVAGSVPLVDVIVAISFCSITVYRLIRHRLDVGQLVLTSRNSKNAFIRLFIVALIGIGSNLFSVGSLLARYVSKQGLAFSLADNITSNTKGLGAPVRDTLTGSEWDVAVVVIDIVASCAVFVLLGLDKEIVRIWKKCIRHRRERKGQEQGERRRVVEDGSSHAGNVRQGLRRSRTLPLGFDDIELELELGLSLNPVQSQAPLPFRPDRDLREEFHGRGVH